MSEKEFPPSIRRLEKARQDGKIVKSRMVSLAVTWWTLLLVLFPAFAWVRDGTLVQWLNYKAWTPQVALVEASWLGCKVIALLVGAVGFSGFAVGLAQSKGLFLPSQLLKGAQQYKPGAFIGRVKESCIDVALGLVRCCFVLVFVAPGVMALAHITPSAFEGATQEAYEGFYGFIRGVFVLGGYAFLIIGAIAYALARWRFYKQMKMSLQEVRDEHKEDEGDPHTKAARKHEHRALLFSEVEKRVKRSKVVVVRQVTGAN
jgi:flagellar biosynthesis protein FlhB